MIAIVEKFELKITLPKWTLQIKIPRDYSIITYNISLNQFKQLCFVSLSRIYNPKRSLQEGKVSMNHNIVLCL